MVIAYLIYLIIFGFSLVVISFKKSKSIYYLPLIFFAYEILKNVFIEFNIEYGVNGFQNLNVFLFIIPHLRRVLKKFGTLFLIIFIFLIYYFLRVPFSEEPISLITQSLGLFNIYTLILVGFTFNLSKHREIFYKLNKSFLTLLITYSVYIILASLLNFGPNHYNTGIIFGLRFEQYYSGAFVIILFPVIANTLTKKELSKYKFFSIIGTIIIILTIRRTAFAILLMGFLFYPLFSDLKEYTIWIKKYAIVMVGFLILVAGIFTYTDLYSFRKTEYSTEYEIQEEGRFIELESVFYTLDIEESYLFGIGKFLNEEGNYNFYNPERALHGTFSKLLLGGGLFGLFLFFLIFANLIFKINRYYSDKSFIKYKAMGITLIVIYLFVSFTGAIGVGTGVSFTGSLFLYVGFLTNILKHSYLDKINNSQIKK